MLKNCAIAICIVSLAACVSSQAPPPAAAAPPPAAPPPAAPPPPATLPSGIDLQYVDGAVRPQDDVYQYLNGKWLSNYQLPPDKGAVGSFSTLQDKTEDQLRTILDSLDQAPGNADPDAKKLADLYASFTNEDRLQALGIKPLLARFAAIDAIKSANAIPNVMARMIEIVACRPSHLPLQLTH